MPPVASWIDPKTLIEWAAVAVVAFAALREQTRTLKRDTADLKAQVTEGQTETLRQIKAVHGRLDDYGTRIGQTEIKHAVLVERVENLRDTQRMRRARLEAEQAGEAPLFLEGHDG
jgi:hypothetical protein